MNSAILSRAPSWLTIRYIVLIFLAMSAIATTDQLPTTGDSASYINLAENLTAGAGYTSSLFWNSDEATMYPPLFPIVLAPVILLAGKNYILLKVLSIILGAASIVLIARLDTFRPQNAMWIAALVAINPCFLSISTGILSEGLYLTLSLVTLVALQTSRRGIFPTAIIPAILMSAVFYTRTIGLALPVSATIYFFITGDRSRALWIAVVFGLLASPWIMFNILPGNTYTVQAVGPGDGNMIVSLLSRIFANTAAYGAKISADLLGGPFVAGTNPYNLLKLSISGLVSSFVLGGFLIRVKELRYIEAYVLSYFAICLVWPFHDWRFVFPLLPFFLGYIFDSVSFIIGRSKGSWNPVVGVTGFATVLVSLMWLNQNRTQYYSPEMAHLRDACEWVGQNTSPEAVILSRKPRLSAMWASRKTGWLSGRIHPEELMKESGHKQVYCVVNDYEVAGENLNSDFRILTEQSQANRQLVFKTASPVVNVYALSLNGEPSR